MTGVCLCRSPWKTAALALFLFFPGSRFAWSSPLSSLLLRHGICINTGESHGRCFELMLKFHLHKDWWPNYPPADEVTCRLEFYLDSFTYDSVVSNDKIKFLYICVSQKKDSNELLTETHSWDQTVKAKCICTEFLLSNIASVLMLF